jgi:hypothetical protein
VASRAIAITKLYDLIVWMTPVTDRFPRSMRHALANRIQNELLDILRLLMEAPFV